MRTITIPCLALLMPFGIGVSLSVAAIDPGCAINAGHMVLNIHEDTSKCQVTENVQLK